jgi:hypothetical protein
MRGLPFLFSSPVSEMHKCTAEYLEYRTEDDYQNDVFTGRLQRLFTSAQQVIYKPTPQRNDADRDGSASAKTASLTLKSQRNETG